MKRLFSVWNLENVKIVKRVIVSVVGVTVLLIGIALLVLPGPAFVVIPVGLAILATEYAWARRWLKRARRIASNVVLVTTAQLRENLVFSFALAGAPV
jgi:tellurite resistance protein TerC